MSTLITLSLILSTFFIIVFSLSFLRLSKAYLKEEVFERLERFQGEVFSYERRIAHAEVTAAEFVNSMSPAAVQSLYELRRTMQLTQNIIDQIDELIEQFNKRVGLLA